MMQGINKYHIALTPDEHALFAKINFELETGRLPDAHQVFLTNQKPLLSLLKSLTDRDGIPPVRVKYWTDPEYFLGRSKTSYRGIFEKNGNRGDEIYTHPHFLKFLRYFLFGADLPAGVIASFEEKVGNPEWMTSSDIVPISHHARSLMREYCLPYEAPEEFFKLALDMGLSLYTASAIQGSAKQSRRGSKGWR